MNYKVLFLLFVGFLQNSLSQVEIADDDDVTPPGTSRPNGRDVITYRPNGRDVITYRPIGRDICENGGDCDTQCTGNDCSYCSEGNCCQSVGCNNCVNNCRNTCRTPVCQNRCVNTCSANTCNSCNTCRSSNCRRSCNQCDNRREQGIIIIKQDSNPSSPSTHGTSSSLNNANNNNNTANITTSIDISNHINNTNHIHIPIYVNSSNVNTITIKHETTAPNTTNSICEVDRTGKYTDCRNQTDCCMVIPPKTCRYETEELKCQQQPYKSCSPICKSPIVMPHPVPVYIPRPYPVPIRVPYPVNHTQIRYVQVPQPIPVPVPVTRTVKEPVYIPQHIPYPVERNVYVPQPVPQPMPVPVPVPVSKPVYITQTVPQPIVVPKFIEVPKYIQQPCPMVYYQGQQMPSCGNVIQSRQFLGSSQQFLIDQFSDRLQYQVTPQCSVNNKYPWLTCNNVQIQKCGGCSFCNGQFNPNCIYSNECPASCSNIMQGLNLPNKIGNNLKCSVSSNGHVTCT